MVREASLIRQLPSKEETWKSEGKSLWISEGTAFREAADTKAQRPEHLYLRAKQQGQCPAAKWAWPELEVWELMRKRIRLCRMGFYSYETGSHWRVRSKREAWSDLCSKDRPVHPAEARLEGGKRPVRCPQQWWLPGIR